MATRYTLGFVVVPPRIPPRPKNTRAIERSIEIACPVDRLFRFHRDTRNAPKVTPNVRFLSITGPFPLDDGDVFEIIMRPQYFPKALHWRFICEAVVHNSAVIDVALRAPFPYWRTEHRFESLGPSRTRLIDRLEYLPPLPGPLVKIAGGMIDKRLGAMTDARLKLTKTLLETRH